MHLLDLPNEILTPILSNTLPDLLPTLLTCKHFYNLSLSQHLLALHRDLRTRKKDIVDLETYRGPRLGRTYLADTEGVGHGTTGLWRLLNEIGDIPVLAEYVKEMRFSIVGVGVGDGGYGDGDFDGDGGMAFRGLEELDGEEGGGGDSTTQANPVTRQAGCFVRAWRERACSGFGARRRELIGEVLPLRLKRVLREWDEKDFDTVEWSQITARILLLFSLPNLEALRIAGVDGAFLLALSSVLRVPKLLVGLGALQRLREVLVNGDSYPLRVVVNLLLLPSLEKACLTNIEDTDGLVGMPRPARHSHLTTLSLHRAEQLHLDSLEVLLSHMVCLKNLNLNTDNLVTRSPSLIYRSRVIEVLEKTVGSTLERLALCLDVDGGSPGSFKAFPKLVSLAVSVGFLGFLGSNIYNAPFEQSLPVAPLCEMIPRQLKVFKFEMFPFKPEKLALFCEGLVQCRARASLELERLEMLYLMKDDEERDPGNERNLIARKWNERYKEAGIDFCTRGCRRWYPGDDICGAWHVEVDLKED